MSASIVSRVPPARVAAVLVAALCGASAHAVPTTQFMCTGYRPLAVEITPKEAQVHFEGSNWALKRVHDNGEARYIDGRDGVSIITKGRELTLVHKAERLACKLSSDALGAPKPPPSAATLSSAPVAAK
jgi:membrane-bound inhibitor of C-type lysozyme